MEYSCLVPGSQCSNVSTTPIGQTGLEMSWAGCENNPIYLNFYLQKSLEIFEKNSADKIWSNKDISTGKSALSRARQG